MIKTLKINRFKGEMILKTSKKNVLKIYSVVLLRR